MIGLGVAVGDGVGTGDAVAATVGDAVGATVGDGPGEPPPPPHAASKRLASATMPVLILRNITSRLLYVTFAGAPANATATKSKKAILRVLTGFLADLA